MKKIKLLILFLSIFILSGCNSNKYNGEVNVLNWTSYIPNEIIRDFEKEYNIKVNYGTYSSNEELYGRTYD